jgi:hypothetical protein
MVATMIRGIHQRSHNWGMRTAKVLVLITLIMSSTLDAKVTRKDRRKMSPALAGIHQILTKLRQQGSFTQARVNELLKTKLVEKDRNDYFAFLENGEIQVEGGMILEKVDLRLRIDGEPHSGFLALSVAKPCISRDEIFAKYGKLNLTSAPTGRSLDEQHAYSLEDSWGKMSFGFAERKPDCLSSIVLEPK